MNLERSTVVIFEGDFIFLIRLAEPNEVFVRRQQKPTPVMYAQLGKNVHYRGPSLHDAIETENE